MYTHTLRCKVALQLVYTVLQDMASSLLSHLEVIGTEYLNWLVCWPACIFQLQLGALAQIDYMTCIVKHGRIHVQPKESLHLCYDLVVHCIPIIFVRQFRSCYMVECRLSLGGSYLECAQGSFQQYYKNAYTTSGIWGANYPPLLSHGSFPQYYKNTDTTSGLWGANYPPSLSQASFPQCYKNRDTTSSLWGANYPPFALKR